MGHCQGLGGGGSGELLFNGYRVLIMQDAVLKICDTTTVHSITVMDGWVVNRVTLC